MQHISALFEAPTPDEPWWSTGFEEFDACAIFRLGQVWVITGPPGVGKSMLLTQWAYRLAVKHGFETQLMGAGPDNASAYRHWIDRYSSSQGDDLDQMKRADFQIWTMSSWSLPDEWTVKRSANPRLLAIDDPEFKKEPVLDRGSRDDLVRFARRARSLVLVTVKRPRFCAALIRVAALG